MKVGLEFFYIQIHPSTKGKQVDDNIMHSIARFLKERQRARSGLYLVDHHLYHVMSETCERKEPFG